MPKQLPTLEQSPHNFDLIMKSADGMGTPKFNEECAADVDIYVKKRQLILAKKEFYAMENYRSETAHQPSKPSGGQHNTMIRSMDCRVKQIRPSTNQMFRGFNPDNFHRSQDSMQGGHIVPG